MRDAPHVTEFVEEALLLREPEAGHELVIADTPGFGDSRRLVARMRMQGQPVGWFLSQVWDRWRDRAFWMSQQALRHVREGSDVLLYLVNASEPDAGYLASEMQLLAFEQLEPEAYFRELSRRGLEERLAQLYPDAEQRARERPRGEARAANGGRGKQTRTTPRAAGGCVAAATRWARRGRGSRRGGDAIACRRPRRVTPPSQRTSKRTAPCARLAAKIAEASCVPFRIHPPGSGRERPR